MKAVNIYVFIFFNIFTIRAGEIQKGSWYSKIQNYFELQKKYFTSSPTQSPVTVEEWYNAAKNRAPAVKAPQPLVAYSVFINYLDRYIALQKEFLNTMPWIDQKINLSNTVLNDDVYMQPFVLKCATTAPNNVYFFGDTHGDIQALSGSLYKLYQDNIIDNNFKIKNPEHLFFFLGDLTDRGEHGPDALTVLFKFATKNPGQVFLIRGNHEDLSMIEKYGFKDQLDEFQKNNASHMSTAQMWYKILQTFNPKAKSPALTKIIQFFNLLPAAAFVGCNNTYIQCCHGGFEPSYNPKRLLEDTHPLCLQALSQKPNMEIEPTSLGFIWNDFSINNTQTFFNARRGVGLDIGRALVEDTLKKYSDGPYKVKAIIRGHQHNSSMPGLFYPENSGVYSLWNGKVFTTIGTGIYTKAPAFIKLELHKNFDQWQLTANNFYKHAWHTRQGLLKDWQNIKD
jgi:hypothetical protein